MATVVVRGEADHRGTRSALYDGEDGEDGSSCSVDNNQDGTHTISCDDGSSTVVENGYSVVTLTSQFPSDDDTISLATDSSQFWNEGEYVEGTRDILGAPFIAGMEFEVDMSSALSCGSLNLDIIVGGEIVDNFDVPPETSQIKHSFIQIIDPPDDEVTFRLEITEDVEVGCGTMGTFEDGQVNIFVAVPH